MSDERRRLGTEGETRAAAHLARRGYRVVGRNVRAGGVEIDLVAVRADVVIFVEVKTRRSRSRGVPEQAVDARKQARLARAAQAWLREQPRRFRRARLDVIACETDGAGTWRVRHLEGAFEG